MSGGPPGGSPGGSLGGSPGGSRRRELRRAGIAAARDARAAAAEAIARLDGDASGAASRALAEALTRAVATLYRAEVGGAEDVRDRLHEAAVALGRVLEAMHAPGSGPALDRAGPIVARALAILHPARAELDRELARAAEPPTEPIDDEPEVSIEEAPEVSIEEAPEVSIEEAPEVSIDEAPEASIEEAPAAVPERPRPAGERRGAHRVPLEAEVGAHAGASFLTGRTGDLSTGGLFVATDDPLGIGTLVTVRLVLPGGERVTLDATVTWVRSAHAGAPGMGLKLTRVSEADGRAIARHLAGRSEG